MGVFNSIYKQLLKFRSKEFDSSMFDKVPADLQVSESSRFKVRQSERSSRGLNHTFSDYTIPIQYSIDAPFAVQETRDVLGMTMDNLLVPMIVEEQLVADRTIELGVYFVRLNASSIYLLPTTFPVCQDTFSDGINRAAFNSWDYCLLILLPI